MSGRETRASRDLTHLSVEQVIAQPRGRGRGSRSPSPSIHPGAKFFPPAFARRQEDDQEEVFADAEEDNRMPFTEPIPADADPAEVRRIAEQARQENLAMMANQERITKALEQATQAAAAAAAALQALSANNQQAAPAAPTAKRKRPELPPFDKSNIHIWIQRVESAYAREEVTDPKQKFAFLESIIGVNLGPTINNFMFGEANAQNWDSFLDHLKDVYGPTKETRCSTYLDGLKRNGLRPSDHLALIQDRAKDVTLDDLQKQLILRELPTDIKRLLQDKVAGLDAQATATLADAHFAKDGQPLNTVASVSSVREPQQHQPTTNNSNNVPEEEASDINAVQGRDRAPRQNYNNRNNSRGNSNSSNNNRSRFTPAFSSGSSRSRTRSSSHQRPTQSQANHNAPPTTSSEEKQYSNCKLHAADPNSQLCNGPLCPLHDRATLCYSRRCNAHGQGGNGRGGRR